MIVFTLYASGREEAERLARLTAHTLANQRPVSGGISRQLYEDLKRAHAALTEEHKAERDTVDYLRSQKKEWQKEALNQRSEGHGEGQRDALRDAAANLASHLHGPALDHLRDSLDQLVYNHTITPEESIAARRSPSALAALLLRVRGPVEVPF